MDTKFTSVDLAKIKHTLKRQVLDAKLHKDSKTWGVMESGSPLTAGLGPLSNYPHSCDHYPIGTCHQDEVYDPNILVAPNRQTELALLKQEIDSKTLHEIITRILEREHFINGDNSMSMEEDLSSGYSSLKSSPNSSNYRYQPEQVGFQPLVIHRSSSPRIQELPFRPLHNESPRVVSATRAMFRNQLEEPMMHHQSLRLNRNYGSGRFSRKPVITALV